MDNRSLVRRCCEVAGWRWTHMYGKFYIAKTNSLWVEYGCSDYKKYVYPTLLQETIDTLMVSSEYYISQEKEGVTIGNMEFLVEDGNWISVKELALNKYFTVMGDGK